MPYDHPKPWLEKPPTKCANPDCDATIIGSWNFYAMSKEIRDTKGLKPHGGQGLCGACHSRKTRNGSLERQPNRRTYSMSDPFPCARCGRTICGRKNGPPPGTLPHAQRGLCNRCVRLSRVDGTLLDYPARTRRNDDVIQEWRELRLQGVRDIRIAAPRMGMSVEALDKALWRARKNGVIS